MEACSDLCHNTNTLKQCVEVNKIQCISSGFSPASNREDVGSVPGQSIQVLSFM